MSQSRLVTATPWLIDGVSLADHFFGDHSALFNSMEKLLEARNQTYSQEDWQKALGNDLFVILDNVNNLSGIALQRLSNYRVSEEE